MATPDGSEGDYYGFIDKHIKVMTPQQTLAQQLVLYRIASDIFFWVFEQIVCSNAYEYLSRGTLMAVDVNGGVTYIFMDYSDDFEAC